MTVCHNRDASTKIVCTQVSKPEVALEQAFAIVNGKKVETSHPQISSTSAVVQVAVDAAHESTCVQLLGQGPQASGVMSSSGPLAATAGGHATHKFAGLSPGTEYTMRTCVRATGDATDAFSETTTFTTLSKEEAAAQQVEHLTAQRDVALHDLAQVREQTGAHAPPSPQHGQTQAAQAALEAKDGELRAVQATLADAQRRLHRAEALEALLPQLRGGLERMGDSLGCAHSADMSVLELLAAVEAAVQSSTTCQVPGAGADDAAAAAAASAGVHDEALARKKSLNAAAAKAAGKGMQLEQLHVLPREVCALRVAALPQHQLEEFFTQRDIPSAVAMLAGSVCLLLGKEASLSESKALMRDPDVRAVLGDVGTALRPVSSESAEMICKLWTAKQLAYRLAAGLWSHGDTPVATTLAEWVAAVVQHTRAEREGGEGGGSSGSLSAAGRSTTRQAPGADAGADVAAAAAAAGAGEHDEALARNKSLNAAAAKAAGKGMQLEQLHVLPREECARRVAALPQRQLEEFFSQRDNPPNMMVLAGSVCLLLGKEASWPQTKALMCDPDVRAALGDVGTALRPVSLATEKTICKLWTAKEVAYCLAAGAWSHGDTPVATTLAEWVAAVVQHTRAEREGGEGGGSSGSLSAAGRSNTSQAPDADAGVDDAAAAAAGAGEHDEALARNKSLNAAAAKAAGRSMQLEQLHVLPREECALRVAALPQRQLEQFFDKRDLSAAEAVLAGSLCLLLGKAASLPQSKALMCDPDVRAVLGDVGTALRPVSSATEEMICKLWTAKEVAHCLAAGPWSHGDTPVATALAEWVAAVVQHTRAEREGGEGGGATASAAKAGTLADESQSSTPSAFASAAGSGSSSTPNTVSAHVQGYVPPQRPPRELVNRFRGHMKQGLEVEAYAAGRAFFSKAPDPCVLAVRSTQAGERLFWVKNNGEKLGDVLDTESSMKVSEITGVDTGSRASSVLRSKASASDDDRVLSIQGGERTLDLRVADKRTAEWLSYGIKLLIADHRGEIEE